MDCINMSEAGPVRLVIYPRILVIKGTSHAKDTFLSQLFGGVEQGGIKMTSGGKRGRIRGVNRAEEKAGQGPKKSYEVTVKCLLFQKMTFSIGYSRTKGLALYCVFLKCA